MNTEEQLLVLLGMTEQQQKTITAAVEELKKQTASLNGIAPELQKTVQAAITAALGLARSAFGILKMMHVGLAAMTVAVSLFLMQLVFALHYAHQYYAPDEQPGPRGRARGLKFPGNEEPDYWDFLHFAVVIGATAQTADIAFTSRSLRRIGTVHSLIAFTFNTVVLALSINLLASLA